MYANVSFHSAARPRASRDRFSDYWLYFPRNQYIHPLTNKLNKFKLGGDVSELALLAATTAQDQDQDQVCLLFRIEIRIRFIAK